MPVGNLASGHVFSVRVHRTLTGKTFEVRSEAVKLCQIIKQSSLSDFSLQKHICKKGMIYIGKYKGMSHIYPKDILALSVAAHCGSISRESLKNFISRSRIKTFEKSLIKKVSYPEKYGTGTRECFVLTDKGKQFVKDECHIDKIVSNGESYHHNENVSRWICQNLNKQEIGSILNERQARDIIEDHLAQYREQGDFERYYELQEQLEHGKISMPDIIYKDSSTGEMVCVEITTSSYKEADIAAKETAANELGMAIQFVSAT